MKKAKRMFVVSNLQHGLMKAVAEEKGITMSALIRKAMDKILREELYPDEPITKLKEEV